ncbi:3-methyl-2-oxobutanoate hydroxymethyltransferase [Gammaproteobacteria bacterium LSUCC0057]|uniref:3-methyl-2-oxobutanoate hydroxymethyltransferase n=1 Tax=Gammaproteobacteria bacterium LSUCC0057 TaxID=2559237 RepID=A0A4Y8UIQ3_9GAMM|nr:3-methyl-2-oxobutanoate hydroxymethyltransferase [Gammaproteobacteria bacterium LSUCC0057]
MQKITLPVLLEKRARGEKFAVLTAYDYTFARLLEQAEIEVVLVGDSLGNVIQGRDSTLPVTVADMVYHTAAVKRGNSRALLISDMPFMSYASVDDALHNAAALMQAGAQMVKIEGGEWLAETVYALTQRGIPVCGHIGLTPQTVHKLGGYKVQGRDSSGAAQLLKDASALEQAGADMMLVECIPSRLGGELRAALQIPLIGIGAGPDTDAQVLVLHDMLGISARLPSFSEDFLAAHGSIVAALQGYGQAVRSGQFPAAKHCFD